MPMGSHRSSLDWRLSAPGHQGVAAIAEAARERVDHTGAMLAAAMGHGGEEDRPWEPPGTLGAFDAPAEDLAAVEEAGLGRGTALHVPHTDSLAEAEG